MALFDGHFDDDERGVVRDLLISIAAGLSIVVVLRLLRKGVPVKAIIE